MQARAVMQDAAMCAADATVDQVAQLMIHREVGAIVIIDLSERPIGIVTDRDILRRIVAEGKNPLAYPVERCMSRPVVTVSVDEPLDHVASRLRSHRIRRAPVVDAAGRCVGIVAEPV